MLLTSVRESFHYPHTPLWFMVLSIPDNASSNRRCRLIEIPAPATTGTSFVTIFPYPSVAAVADAPPNPHRETSNHARTTTGAEPLLGMRNSKFVTAHGRIISSVKGAHCPHRNVEENQARVVLC
jgi:hypothetical protein